MTKNEKKELFLIIVETWFDDTQVNTENCINFYNYLLDCLEFEAEFSPEYQNGFNSFLRDFIDLLYDFPDHSDKIVMCLEQTMINYRGLLEHGNLKNHCDKIRELFEIFKDEYFL